MNETIKIPNSNIYYEVSSDKFFSDEEHIKLSQPLSVCIPVISGCNLSCYYCFNNAQIMESFSLAQFKNGIDNLKIWSPMRLLISGGEPMLHKDLGKMLLYAKKNGFKPILSTHGMYLKQKIKEIHKNLSWLDISLHSLNNETYKSIRGSDSLAQVLDGIDEALKLKARIRLNFIILNENKHEIEDVLKFAVKKGVKFIRFINEYPHNKNMHNPKRNYEDRKLEILKQIYSKKGLNIIIPKSNISGTKQSGYLLLSKNGYIYTNSGYKKRTKLYDFKSNDVKPEFSESIEYQTIMFKVKS